MENKVNGPHQEKVENATESSTVRTEYDAVHPRFQIPPDPKLVEQYQFENDFFCFQCRMYFASDIDGLKTHFRANMVEHQAVGNCFYCTNDVYVYYFRGYRLLYHNCPKPSEAVANT